MFWVRFLDYVNQTPVFFSTKKTTRHRKKPEINHTKKNCDDLFWVIKFIFSYFINLGSRGNQPGKPWDMAGNSWFFSGVPLVGGI